MGRIKNSSGNPPSGGLQSDPAPNVQAGSGASTDPAQRSAATDGSRTALSSAPASHQDAYSQVSTTASVPLPSTNAAPSLSPPHNMTTTSNSQSRSASLPTLPDGIALTNNGTFSSRAAKFDTNAGGWLANADDLNAAFKLLFNKE